MQPWDRMPDEPSLWFSRFERFRLMGPGRTLLGAVHAEEAEKGSGKRSKKTPGAWDDAARKWNWRGRADASDRAESEATRDRIETERAEWRDRLYGQLRETVDKHVRQLQKIAELPLVRVKSERQSVGADGLVTNVTVLEPDTFAITRLAKMTSETIDNIERLLQDGTAAVELGNTEVFAAMVSATFGDFGAFGVEELGVEPGEVPSSASGEASVQDRDGEAHADPR